LQTFDQHKYLFLFYRNVTIPYQTKAGTKRNKNKTFTTWKISSKNKYIFYY